MHDIESLFNARINPQRPTRVVSQKRISSSENYSKEPMSPQWLFGEVRAEPHLRFCDWSAVDLIELGKTDRSAFTTHFIGRVEGGQRLTFSSELHRFDPHTRRGMTTNGTVYELVGDPDLWGPADDKFFKWVNRQNILTRNHSTREFVYAIGARNSARYTVSLKTFKSGVPIVLGTLDIKAKGSLCDATYVGRAWSDELFTLKICDHPRAAESLSCLLVRLFEQIPQAMRVHEDDSLGHFTLSIHFGDSVDPGMRVESITTYRTEFTSTYFEYEDMHRCILNREVDGQTEHPLDCVLQNLPLLWRHHWNLESVLPLDAYLLHPEVSDDSTWKNFPWLANLGMHSQLQLRHSHFFHKDWRRKHGCVGAAEQWLRFLEFNGIKPQRLSKSC